VSYVGAEIGDSGKDALPQAYVVFAIDVFISLSLFTSYFINVISHRSRSRNYGCSCELHQERLYGEAFIDEEVVDQERQLQKSLVPAD